jgi:quercetin dioxygenase-like cupin family protein
LDREPNAFHVPPGGGERVWVADELMTFVISGRETGGAYTLTDSTVPPEGEAPPHVHRREDEAFWVLEGELEITAGQQTFVAQAGSFVHLPRDVPHTYKNVGPGPARFLTLMAPAGLEQFFREVGSPDTGSSTPPPFGDREIQRLLEAAPKYGVEILPPAE